MSSKFIIRMIDRAGRLAGAAQDGNTTFEYNELGMLLSEGYSGGTLGTRTVSYAYNNGLLLRTNMVMSTHAETEIGYQYDSASRLTNVISGEFTAGYTYHPNSSLLNQTVSRHNGTNRLVVARSYDKLNRLTQIISTPGAADQMPWNYTYSYNQANQRTNVLLADGSKWSYTYDSLGQVTSGKRKWADGTYVAGQQFEYAYDEIGNRTSSKRGGDSAGANLRESGYTANLLNQYEDRANPGYLDVLGIAISAATVEVNGSSSGVERKGQYFRKELTVSNSGSAQYPSISVQAIKGTNSSPTESGNLFVPKANELFIHNEDGNLKTDGRWEYTWDAENRLTKLESLSGAPSGSARKLEFRYDWRGRRIYKKETDLDTSTVVSESIFLQDDWNIYAELTPGGSLRHSYIWGNDLSGNMQDAGGVGGLLGIKPIGNRVHFSALDGIGNVIGFVAGEDGLVTASYEYGAFGEELRATGSVGKNNPVRFSSKYTDESSRLSYYGFRYYDAVQGRWLSRDPLMEFAGPNPGLFVANSPLVYFDAFGLIGHHYVIGPIRFDPNVSEEARAVFRAETTGDIGPHNYSSPHPAYNQAVLEQWRDWIRAKDPAKLTAKQAEAFVKRVKKCPDPRIKNFLDDLHKKAKRISDAKVSATKKLNSRIGKLKSVAALTAGAAAVQNVNAIADNPHYLDAIEAASAGDENAVDDAIFELANDIAIESGNERIIPMLYGPWWWLKR